MIEKPISCSHPRKQLIRQVLYFSPWILQFPGCFKFALHICVMGVIYLWKATHFQNNKVHLWAWGLFQMKHHVSLLLKICHVSYSFQSSKSSHNMWRRWQKQHPFASSPGSACEHQIIPFNYGNHSFICVIFDFLLRKWWHKDPKFSVYNT